MYIFIIRTRILHISYCKFIQNKFSFSDYEIPILVGYSSGATLAYAALSQAPSQTFKRAISLGFCPDLPLSRPLCRGSGLEWTRGPNGKGYSFLPTRNLETPWIVLQGDIDEVCDAAETAQFVRQVPRGELVRLPKVGHGFSVQRNWLPQLEQSLLKIEHDFQGRNPVPPSSLRNLPIVEIPAKTSNSDLFGIFITGDGGWGEKDRGISSALAEQGIPMVGFNSLKYFWNRKTPEQAALDLERIILNYKKLWGKNECIVIGYSLGADVLPFMINRLTPAVKNDVAMLVFLGISGSVDFHFAITDWFGNFAKKNALDILPELNALKGRRMLFFYGKEDSESIAGNLDKSYGTMVELQGGHRIGNRIEPIVKSILQEIHNDVTHN